MITGEQSLAPYRAGTTRLSDEALYNERLAVPMCRQFDLIDASKPLVLALSLLWLIEGIRRSIWQVIDDSEQ